MKKFYVTTPIYYANAPPHLGHAYTNIIADVFARYHRAQGDTTFFLTGTDEHGAKIVRAAEKAGKPVEQFVSERREEFKNLLAKLNCSQDFFISTSDTRRHWPGARALWNQLFSAGDLYKAPYRGLYCVGHEAFVTEKDLKDGVCQDHNQTPEIIEEENYFFRLSKYITQIQKAIENDEYRILPKERKHEVLAFLKEGASDISFSRPSRDIGWGIPVPHDAEHTMYVWADALTNYISALGYGSSDTSQFAQFWPADVHIIGKDILRFHAVIWPGMLLAVGLPLPKMLYVHGMIHSDGKKMSKTIGNVANPFDYIATYGEDAFRYFCMREIPFGGDGDFTQERFSDVYEGNLAHGLGNLVARVSTMIEKYFSGMLDAPRTEDLAGVPSKRMLRQEISHSPMQMKGEGLEGYFRLEVEPEYEKAFHEPDLTRAIHILWQFFSLLDGYIQDYEPYRLVRTNPEKTRLIVWNLAIHIVHSMRLLEPFMPNTALHILQIFGVSPGDRTPTQIRITKHEALFPSRIKEASAA